MVCCKKCGDELHLEPYFDGGVWAWCTNEECTEYNESKLAYIDDELWSNP